MKALQSSEEQSINTLLKVIADLKKMTNQLKSNVRGKKKKTILFIGNTGCGKSTLFNWLSGAKFKFNEEKKRVELIQEKGKNYSAQGDQLESITFEPNFYQIDDEHLLIDFPGFKDTKGIQNQLSIQLMFNEIVSSTDVKIVVVIEQQSIKISNRGIEVVQLVQNTFTSSKVELESIGLVFNKFNNQNKDKIVDVVQTFIMQLAEIEKKQETSKKIYQVLQKNVMVVQKQSKASDEAFGDLQKRYFLGEIKKITPIQYQPKNVDQDNIVSDYVESTINRLFQMHSTKLFQQKEKATETKDQKFYDYVKNQMQRIKFNCSDHDQVLKWMQDNIFANFQNEEVKNKFVEIFSFFFKYQEYIQGFQSFKENIQRFEEKLQFILKEQEAEIKKIQDLQKQFEMEQKRLKVEEMQKIQREKEQYQAEIKKVKQAAEKRERMREDQKRKDEEQAKHRKYQAEEQEMRKRIQEEETKKEKEQQKKVEEDRLEKIRQEQKTIQEREETIQSYKNQLKNKKNQLEKTQRDKQKVIEEFHSDISFPDLLIGTKFFSYMRLQKQIGGFNQQIANLESNITELEQVLLKL